MRFWSKHKPVEQPEQSAEQPASGSSTHVVHERYATDAPSQKSLAAIFADDWVSSLPGLGFGSVGLFDDHRIRWASKQAGGVAGKRVLELGPLEGGHTFMLHNAGAASVTSIEANTHCFLRCLVVKSLYDLNRANFLFGNFIPWLEQQGEKYDLTIAAGVLYHMVDPLNFIDLLCRTSDQLYIWTHYADVIAMPEDDPRYQNGVIGTEMRDYQGTPYQCFKRHYAPDSDTDPKFCGGVHKNPVWIEKKTIFMALEANGFSFETDEDRPDHPNGPCVSIFAKRRT